MDSMDVDGIDVMAKVYNQGSNSSLTLRVNNEESSVGDLVSEIYCSIQLSPEDFTLELIHCGRVMMPDKSLSHYKIKSRSCVNVIVKPTEQITPDKIVSKLEVEAALVKLMNPAYRSTIETILTSTDIIDNIIAKSKQLQKDLVAQSILKDLNLIGILADSGNVDSVLDKHPCLASATIKVCDVVMERVNKHGVTPARTRNTQYALDRMSDDEEEPQAGAAASRAAAASQITANQLASALAMATAAAGARGGATSSASPSQTASGATPQVNTSALSAALSQALGSPQTAAAANTQQSSSDRPADYSSQLEQLRDMGITDNTVALQALQAAGGNVHLALDIIYGSVAPKTGAGRC